MRRHVRLQVNNDQDLEFDGVLLGEYSTQNAAGTKDRWTEVRLWETRSKAWVVESVGCSSRGGDVNLRDARVIDTASASENEAELDVMAFLGWTIVAKAFAREMGWDVVRRVD